jgi:hypothetical protein
MPSELPQDQRPLRFQVRDGLVTVLELLLVPDSSGKTSSFMGWDGDADEEKTVLTVCTLPMLLLSQRIYPEPSWGLLTKRAEMLKEEAFYLRDGTHYKHR